MICFTHMYNKKRRRVIAFILYSNVDVMAMWFKNRGGTKNFPKGGLSPLTRGLKYGF